MKNFTSQNRITIICVLLLVCIGIIYSATTAKIYTSKSHIALFRIKIENPDLYSEESRNRWVWIRDGLNLKSALVTDSMLEDLIHSNLTAKEKSIHYPNKYLMIEYLRSLINIQFTGADENNFLVEVKATSPSLAYDLNNKIFERIKFLAVDADQSNFNNVLNELLKKQTEFKHDADTYAFYQDKIRKMIFTNTIEQKQRETAYQIITKPILNEQAIWPDHKLIIMTSAFIGLVMGLSLTFLIKHCQSEK